MAFTALGRELLEPQELSKLDGVIFRLDRYIDLIDFFKENFIVNSQYDNLPISHSILYRV
jgi:hypothetical protein